MLHFHFRNMMITIQLRDKSTTDVSLPLQLAGREASLTMNHNLILPRSPFHIDRGNDADSSSQLVARNK